MIERATRWRDASRRYDRGGGRFLVLPLASRGWGPARLLTSLPHGWGYGGLLASDGVVDAEDAAVVAADVARSGAARVTVTPSPFLVDPWLTGPWPGPRTDYLCQAIDLASGRDAVLAGYSRNVRWSIRRARRVALTVTRDVGGGGLEEFRVLHASSAERWARGAGRPRAVGRWQARFSEPAVHLRTVAAMLGQDCAVWTAWHEGRPAASLVVLSHGQHALAWRAAMDHELGPQTQAATWLHHLAIEAALEEGRYWYSFGESDEGAGLAAFKAKFGALPLRWSAHHLERLPVTATIGSARATHHRLSRLAGAGLVRSSGQGEA